MEISKVTFYTIPLGLSTPIKLIHIHKAEVGVLIEHEMPSKSASQTTYGASYVIRSDIITGKSGCSLC